VSAPTSPPARESLLSPRYRGTTIGVIALVFLAAFEALAVATVMPTVSRELDGRALFAAAFSSALAASLVGMVVAGLWADRRGAVRPLLVAVAVFGLGLLVAGLAPTMPVLVAGRVLQGLGGGGLTVALYVLVAQVYDDVDRARILGALAAAWVLPGIVGPALAGLVSETLGWRWVFLGVLGLAGVALALMARTLAGVAAPAPTAAVPGSVRRVLLAALVAAALVAAALLAAALLALNAAAGLHRGLAWPLAALAVVLALAALRPLLPAGTLRAGRGLASVVALRGLIGATFFATEAYLPYLLQEQYGAAVATSGLVLTGATLGWAGASQVQARLGDALADADALRGGALGLVAGIGGILVVAATHAPGPLVVLGWVVAAGGMGLMYPRITRAVLARSAEHERGTASAAVTLADAVGAATAIALAGLVFTSAGTAADRSAFVAVLVLTTALGATAVVVSRRV
jgi:MFS family permease